MWACIHIDKYMHIIKTDKLKVENLAQTSFKFSLISFRAPAAAIFPPKSLAFETDTLRTHLKTQLLFSPPFRHFSGYCHTFHTVVLEEEVLPQLLLGIRDCHDQVDQLKLFLLLY